MSDKTSTSDRHFSQCGILLSKLLTHNEYIHCSFTILLQKGQFSSQLTWSITICLVKEVLNDTFRVQNELLGPVKAKIFFNWPSNCIRKDEIQNSKWAAANTANHCISVAIAYLWTSLYILFQTYFHLALYVPCRMINKGEDKMMVVNFWKPWIHSTHKATDIIYISPKCATSH